MPVDRVSPNDSPTVSNFVEFSQEMNENLCIVVPGTHLVQNDAILMWLLNLNTPTIVRYTGFQPKSYFYVSLPNFVLAKISLWYHCAAVAAMQNAWVLIGIYH